MPVLDSHHDLGHPYGDSPDWSESWYFNGYAPESSAGFFARIAIRPNEPNVDGFLTVWLPDGRTLRVADSRSTRVPDVNAPAVDCLKAERLEAMRAWRLSGRGKTQEGHEIALDLHFTAITPAIGVDASGRASTEQAGAAVMASLGSGHFEQSGRWLGEIRVDDAVFAFDGRGNRDKSWGPRRADGAHGMRYWRWFSMNFGDEVHLGGIRVGTAGPVMERGWLYRHGSFVSLRGMEVHTVLDADGLTQRKVRLLARDANNEQHLIEGEVLRVATLTARGHEHMAIIEALTRWTYGDLTGYGICEYAHQLDPEGQPLVAIV